MGGCDGGKEYKDAHKTVHTCTIFAAAARFPDPFVSTGGSKAKRMGNKRNGDKYLVWARCAGDCSLASILKIAFRAPICPDSGCTLPDLALCPLSRILDSAHLRTEIIGACLEEGLDC